MSSKQVFDGQSTADQVADALGSELKGKVVIVTGAFSGLGKETARVFARKGAHVILALRNLETGKAAVDEIIQTTGNQNVESLKLELSSLAAIREFVQAFEAKNLPLHYLINNAGIMAVPERKLTADGFESQFGTNHIGHFYLTNLLAPTLIKSAPSRVVNVSSGLHRTSPIHFDDIMLEKKYDKWESYGQSKTANILFTVELEKRLQKFGVTSVSLHPGVIITNLARDVPREEFIKNGVITPEGKPNPALCVTLEQGTATHFYAALADAQEVGGKYLEKCAVATPAAYASDEANAARLWEISEKLVGKTFSY